MMFQISRPITGSTGDAPGNTRFGRRRSALRSWIMIVILVALIACAPALYANYERHSQTEAHLYRGQDLLQQGQPQAAEREWQAAVRLTPENPNPLRALGELYRAQGRMQEASAAYNRLADLRPHEPHPLCGLAIAEKSLVHGWDLSPIAQLTAHDALRAAALEPDCVRALTVAGDVCIERGDQKRGLDFLRRAVHLKPEDVPLTLHCINCQLAANDIAGALNLARDLTRRYPGYAQGYAVMASVCNLYPPDSPEARPIESLLLTALRLDPTNALAHLRLGSFYLKAHAAARSIPHLTAARLLGYQRADLIFQLAEVYRQTGQTALAQRALREFNQISRLENTLNALEKQSAMDPDNADLRSRLTNANAALAAAQRAYDLGSPSLNLVLTSQKSPSGETK